MKKYCVLLSVLMVAGIVHAVNEPSLRDYAIVKLFGSLLVGSVVKTVGDAASENHTIQKLGNAVGLNPRDITKTAAVMSTFGSYAFFESDPQQKETYRYVATRLPLIVAGMGIAFNQKFQIVLKNTKLVGDFIVCENPECSGICIECATAKGAVGYAISKALCVGADWMINYFSKTSGSN